MDVLKQVLTALQESYVRVGMPKTVAVAVSGGADSVALLFLLKTLTDLYPIQLICCHVNHGLRDESSEEALFVQSLCETWHIPFHARALSLQITSNIEETARKARYAALWDMAKDTGAEMIATGHHQEDQAETVLMHLMYGAGGRGLAGMKEFNRGIWRPLLQVSKEDLKAMLNEQQVPWREDKTNQSNIFIRNAIRNTVLPQMHSLYPDVTSRMAQTAAILSAQEDMLDNWTAAWLKTNALMQGDVCWCDKAALLVEDIALQRKIVRKLAGYYKLSLGFVHVEKLLKDINSSLIVKINLPMEHWAYTTHTKVHFLPPRPIAWPLGSISFSSPAYLLGDGLFTQAFDADMIQGAVLRVRQRGDFIQPMGQQGKQSLKQYMVNRKIDQPFRDIWPVLAKGNQVLWVIGYGPSQAAAISNKTINAVFAQYNGMLPDYRNGEK